MPKVPPQTTATLIAGIDANVTRAKALATGLTDAQFNWSPAPGVWSIGQNLGHLIATDGGAGLEAIRASIAKGRGASLTGPGPFRCGPIATKFILTQMPPVTAKFKAPKPFLPPPNLASDTTLNTWLGIADALRKAVESADGLDLGRITTRLPALPPILRSILRMTLVARLALLNIHGSRHIWQIEQIRGNPGFPK